MVCHPSRTTRLLSVSSQSRRRYEDRQNDESVDESGLTAIGWSEDGVDRSFRSSRLLDDSALDMNEPLWVEDVSDGSLEELVAYGDQFQAALRGCDSSSLSESRWASREEATGGGWVGRVLRSLLLGIWLFGVCFLGSQAGLSVGTVVGSAVPAGVRPELAPATVESEVLVKIVDSSPQAPTESGVLAWSGDGNKKPLGRARVAKKVRAKIAKSGSKTVAVPVSKVVHHSSNTGLAKAIPLESSARVDLVTSQLVIVEPAQQADFMAAAASSLGSMEQHAEMGRVLFRMGQYGRSINEWKSCIKLNPDHGEAYRFVGLAYAKLGRVDEAVASFERFVKLEPGHNDVDWMSSYVSSLPGEHSVP